jgi:hypothetical protein
MSLDPSEYQRKPQTLHELAKVLGFDGRAAIKEDRRVKKFVGSLNKKFEKRKLIRQMRAFRENQKRDLK